MDKLISQLGATAGVVSTDVFEIEKLAGPPSEKATIAQLVTLLDTLYAPITGGAYVLKAGDTMTGRLIITQATANTSVLTSTGYSLTGANAQNMLDFAGTWNTSGNPTALKIAITNTASGATSKFLEFFAGAGGATTVFSVDKAGTAASVAGFSVVGGGGALLDTSLLVSNLMYWSTRSVMSSPVNGNIRFTNNAQSDFGLLQLGGTTSAFPAIKRSTTILQVRLADDSAYAPFEANTIRTATAYTVGTLPAAGVAGKRSYVTDALAPAFGAIVAGAGAVIIPVYDDGTNWRVG